ncbi:glucuronate isomerase [Mobiluncus mulieris]|uniref:glucuronate isomerase n=1 Tax=Mobiluncus mulieris TaxID=2052 RepID=UPI00147019DD|nr:glucuronate isomerase [Mobiluncus mulieris]MCU9996026.1 glucuronate isomerase [Mobiluncus mulieris]NMW59510.1 glucuronate isomerase [Mobiluncus mulieris]
MEALKLNEDRLFPADSGTRDVARELYAEVRDLPIISPHGHVSPKLLLDNGAFADASELFLRWDHYVFRMLNAAGVDLETIGVGKVAMTDPRGAWRVLCENWRLFDGTASGYWLTHEFVTLFGIDVEPSAETADAIYDQIGARLQDADFRPQALFNAFQIEFMATTDDPLDSLADHEALARLTASGELGGRVAPTWRPDAYVNARKPEFRKRVTALTDSIGAAPHDFQGYLKALRESRARFVAAGAVSADYGVSHPKTLDLDDSEMSRLYQSCVDGNASAEQMDAFEAGMLLRFAGMSLEDGLVMTIHPGVYRNHCSVAFERFGPDTGHDIPVATEYTRGLQPLLDRYGNERDLHLVLFTMDETTYSREIAPLAGYYRSVYIGAPWWFIDAPDSILRFHAATTESAGFSRLSGFIDDTRAFLSIPARHDMNRRLDAAFLARYVREGRLSLTAAHYWIRRLTVNQPREVFKL